jgi:hypothetical protein
VGRLDRQTITAVRTEVTVVTQHLLPAEFWSTRQMVEQEDPVRSAIVGPESTHRLEQEYLYLERPLDLGGAASDWTRVPRVRDRVMDLGDLEVEAAARRP